MIWIKFGIYRNVYILFANYVYLNKFNQNMYQIKGKLNVKLVKL